MARQGFPSDKQDQFVVRLPDGLRDRIKVAADGNNRSMNAEIVAILEAALPAETPMMLKARKIALIVERLETDIEEIERARLEEELSDTISALQRARPRTGKRLLHLGPDEQVDEESAHVHLHQSY